MRLLLLSTLTFTVQQPELCQSRVFLVGWGVGGGVGDASEIFSPVSLREPSDLLSVVPPAGAAVRQSRVERVLDKSQSLLQRLFPKVKGEITGYTYN